MLRTPCFKITSSHSMRLKSTEVIFTNIRVVYTGVMLNRTTCNLSLSAVFFWYQKNKIKMFAVFSLIRIFMIIFFGFPAFVSARQAYIQGILFINHNYLGRKWLASVESNKRIEYYTCGVSISLREQLKIGEWVT